MRGACVVSVYLCFMVGASWAEKQHPESTLSVLSKNSKRSADYDETQDLTEAANEVLVASESVLTDIDEAMPRADRFTKRRRNRHRYKRPRYQSQAEGGGDWDYNGDKYSNYPSEDTYKEETRYFEDRDGAPSQSYNAPSQSYEAPSYNAPSYEAPSYEAPADSYGAPTYSGGSGGGGGDSFNDFLNALAAFLPIGLFLAAIPPNLIVINSVKKRRSADDDLNSVEGEVGGEMAYPFLKRINQIGYSRFSNQLQCQKMIFCEMAEFGAMEEANFIQKIFGYAVALSPDILTDRVGLKDVFQAARDARCGKYDCQLSTK